MCIYIYIYICIYTFISFKKYLSDHIFIYAKQLPKEDIVNRIKCLLLICLFRQYLPGDLNKKDKQTAT